MEHEVIERNIRYTRWVLFWAAALAFAAFAIACWNWFHLDKYKTPDAWGQLGDYFGGILNPLVGACTLYWLLVSVRIQRTELSETRQALSRTQLAAEHQARLALLASRIENINIQLSILGAEISHYRNARLYYVQCANSGSGHIPKVITETGKYADPLTLISFWTERIDAADNLQTQLLEQLTGLLKAHADQQQPA